jgi:outer membrane protein TolC
LAAVENGHGVALAAVAELAQSYMQLRGTQNRLGIAKRNLRLAEENVELVNTRFGNGQICSDDRERGPTGLARSVICQPPLSWVVILRVRRSLPVFPDKQTF